MTAVMGFNEVSMDEMYAVDGGGVVEVAKKVVAYVKEVLTNGGVKVGPAIVSGSATKNSVTVAIKIKY